MLLDPSLPDFETELKDTEEAGRAIWSHVLIMKAALQSTSRHRKKSGQPSLRGDQLIEKGAIITGE